jgi:Protein of unknown function (DUF732)
MTAKTTPTGRKLGSAVRKLGLLERLLVVAAIAAVLVAVGAWFAMNRPADGAEVAGSESPATGGVSGGASAGGSGTGGEATGDAADASSATSDDAASDESATDGGSTGGSSSGSSGTGGGSSGSSGSSGSGGSSGAGATSRPSGSSFSPTTAFLNALNASGMAPPVEDAQKLAMAEDVCQELKNGATYDDMVRALTFAGATDAEAANFARLSIENLCPQFDTD